MTKDEAILRLNDEKQYHINKNGVVYTDRTEAIDLGVKALSLFRLLHNRPCEACINRKENGCCRWTCDFDEMIYERE